MALQCIKTYYSGCLAPVPQRKNIVVLNKLVVYIYDHTGGNVMNNLISTLGGDLPCYAGVTYSGSCCGGGVDEAANRCVEQLSRESPTQICYVDCYSDSEPPFDRSCTVKCS